MGVVRAPWKKLGLVRQEERKIDADALMNPTPWNQPSLPAPTPSAHCPAPALPVPQHRAGKFHFVWLMCAHTQPAPSLSSPPHTPLKSPSFQVTKENPLDTAESSPFPFSQNRSPKLQAGGKRLSRTPSLPPPRPASPRQLLYSSDDHLRVSIPYPVSAAQAAAARRGPLTPTETNQPRQHPGAPRSVPTPASLPLQKKNPTLPPPQPLTCTARSPPRQSQEGARSPEEPGSGGAGGRAVGEAFAFFPPPLLGRVGACWRGASCRGGEWWVGAQPGLGSGNREVSVRRPPVGVRAQTLSCSPRAAGSSERAAAAPGCGRDSFSKRRPLREATGDRRRGGGPAPARIRRQLWLFGFPLLRVGRSETNTKTELVSLRNSKLGEVGRGDGKIRENNPAPDTATHVN